MFSQQRKKDWYPWVNWRGLVGHSCENGVFSTQSCFITNALKILAVEACPVCWAWNCWSILYQIHMKHANESVQWIELHVCCDVRMITLISVSEVLRIRCMFIPLSMTCDSLWSPRVFFTVLKIRIPKVAYSCETWAWNAIMMLWSSAIASKPCITTLQVEPTVWFFCATDCSRWPLPINVSVIPGHRG